MTTAARPTWAPAKGGNEQGGTRIFGPSGKYSSRDLAAHTSLKPRKEGQQTQEEVQKRNLRDELEERERKHFSSKDKSYVDERDRRKSSGLLLEGSKRDEDKIVPREIDADDSDVEPRSDDESDDDDDDDDTEALMAVCALISEEELVEFIPCFFGGLEKADVSAVLGCDSHVDHVDGGGVELVIHHFSSCQFSWVSWKEGQQTQEEVHKRNLRDELEERERKHFSSKDKSYVDERDRRKSSGLLLEGSKRDEDKIVPREIDADDSDVEPRSDDESDDDDDDDDTEALMAELERIKKERAEDKLRKDRQQAEEEAKMKEAELMRGNPLINMNNAGSFNVKRRWDDDVVFKNQARGETKTPKRFINDTIRSDFHRKFLHRYMK